MVAVNGDQLRMARVSAGLSQAKLAAAVGVTVHVVGRWERGDTQPTPEQVQRLAYALGVDIASLHRPPAVPTLADLRKSRGVAQAEVAAAIGVSIASYRQMERGALSDDLLVRNIAAVLDYPPGLVLAAVDADRGRGRGDG